MGFFRIRSYKYIKEFALNAYLKMLSFSLILEKKVWFYKIIY
jgi:hypothetical protein